MGDFKSYPPRQADFRINLWFKDLAYLMRQAAESSEVLSFLSEEELQRISESLQSELNFRQTKGEENAATASQTE